MLVVLADGPGFPVDLLGELEERPRPLVATEQVHGLVGPAVPHVRPRVHRGSRFPDPPQLRRRSAIVMSWTASFCSLAISTIASRAMGSSTYSTPLSAHAARKSTGSSGPGMGVEALLMSDSPAQNFSNLLLLPSDEICAFVPDSRTAIASPPLPGRCSRRSRPRCRPPARPTACRHAVHAPRRVRTRPPPASRPGPLRATWPACRSRGAGPPVPGTSRAIAGAAPAPLAAGPPVPRRRQSVAGVPVRPSRWTGVRGSCGRSPRRSMWLAIRRRRSAGSSRPGWRRTHRAPRSPRRACSRRPGSRATRRL